MSEAQGPPGSASGDELRRALDDLRREIEARVRERPPGGRSWFELFDDLRRRANSFGMAERSVDVDEFGMDELSVRRARPLLDFLLDRYWRAHVDGLAHLPSSGAALLVANRSGLLPWDGLLLAHAVARWDPRGERPRFLVDDSLVTLPFVQPLLARLGGVRACRENAERLLRRGRLVIAFPEGQKGSTKVFRERYRLKRFARGGVVRVALSTGAPLLPVGIVGAEEVNPVLFKLGAPARALLGIPSLPVTPTFPLLGPLGLVPLPSKWVIRIGEPLAMDRLAPDAARDELLVSRLTNELRVTIARLVEEGLRSRPGVWA